MRRQRQESLPEIRTIAIEIEVIVVISFVSPVSPLSGIPPVQQRSGETHTNSAEKTHLTFREPRAARRGDAGASYS